MFVRYPRILIIRWKYGADATSPGHVKWKVLCSSTEETSTPSDNTGIARNEDEALAAAKLRASAMGLADDIEVVREDGFADPSARRNPNTLGLDPT
jgi:hypothetical protein